MSESFTGHFTGKDIIEFIENEKRFSDGGIIIDVKTERKDDKTRGVENEAGVSGLVDDKTQELLSDNNSDDIKGAKSSDTFHSCESRHFNNNLSDTSSDSELRRKGYDHICRICHELGRKDVFLSPCNCKGTIASVHRECLERWLAERDTNRCEICGYCYSLVRIPKFGILKAMFIWLTSEDTQRDRREVLFDLIGISLFAPIVTAGTYIGFIFADAIESMPPNDEPEVNINELVILASGRMALLTIISVMITFDVAYATWIAVRLQNHINNWYAWYRRNSMVTLLIPTRCQDS